MNTQPDPNGEALLKQFVLSTTSLALASLLNTSSSSQSSQDSPKGSERLYDSKLLTKAGVTSLRDLVLKASYDLSGQCPRALRSLARLARLFRDSTRVATGILGVKLTQNKLKELEHESAVQKELTKTALKLRQLLAPPGTR